MRYDGRKRVPKLHFRVHVSCDMHTKQRFFVHDFAELG